MGRQDGSGEGVAGQWGNLPPREREEAEQYLREKFPTRYRELIEKYYRAIAEEDR